MEGGGRERERWRKERRKEGRKQGTKEPRKTVFYWLMFRDLGFHQLILGLVMVLTFEIEGNLNLNLVFFYNKVLFVLSLVF